MQVDLYNGCKMVVMFVVVVVAGITRKEKMVNKFSDNVSFGTRINQSDLWYLI